MFENYGQNQTLSNLASMTSLSVSQFCKRFKAIFAITPHAYLVDLRLDRAGELLRDTNMPVATIAKDCGFYAWVAEQVNQGARAPGLERLRRIPDSTGAGTRAYSCSAPH